MTVSCIEEHELEKCDILLPNMVVFYIFVLSDTANTSVFGWFDLRAGSNKREENTGIYHTF